MEGAKSSKSVVRGDEDAPVSTTDASEQGGVDAAGSQTRTESDEEDITLGPGWMRSGSRTLTLSGTREWGLSSSGVVPTGGTSKVLSFCYTKEEVLALHSSVGDEYPSDFLALPYILSEEPLLPVNLSQDLIKDFEELQRKYLYNICPSRGSASATRGATRGRGRGRGRGSERELRPRDKDALSGSGSGSGVYRPPRGRGRLGYSWEGDRENERRPAWADTPIDKDAPKGRFSGGRFRGDSDSEGSELEDKDERAYSDSEEVASEEEYEVDDEPGPGWMYKDPQNIVRGPFSNQDMFDWFMGGFFPATLPVKKETDDDFKPLSSYEGNPFARQRKKKEKPVVRREKLREMHAAELEGKAAAGRSTDWGDRSSSGSDWRKRSGVSEQRERPRSEKKTEHETKPKDEGNWRLDNTKDLKVTEKQVAGASPSVPSKEAPAKKPEEKISTVAKNAEEIIKASKEAERARKEREEKQKQEAKKKEATATSAQPQPTAAAPTKPKSAAAAVKRDSVDMSDPESLDDILDQFPHLNADLIASSDDEAETERPSPFPGGAARGMPLGAWPPAKASWSAQELEMRQFQQFGGAPGAPVPVGKPSGHPMHPHPAFPGMPEGKAPFMQPPHPMMGPGQPTPQQFFAGAMQPGFPPHAGHPGMRPGVPVGSPGPHHLPNLERRQGVFDMAAIEEQLMKQSHMPPMHMQPPHMPPVHVPPHGAPHAAPWLMHAKPGHAPTLREIQEQELRERQQRQQMAPQAFPHQFPPEQMLHLQHQQHHHQMLNEQHKQMHPAMRQPMAMGMRPESIFQAVWGISPDGTPLSAQEIQARIRSEQEEEARRARGAAANESVEQALHDTENKEHQHQHHEQQADAQEDASAQSPPTSNQAKEEEEGIWDVPAAGQPQQQKQQKQPKGQQPAKGDQQPKQSKKQAKQQQQQQQQQQKKKGGNQQGAAQQQPAGKQKGGAAKSPQTAPKPSLREIQEQEQRELLERQKQQKQQHQAQDSGDGKGLHQLLSAWGFSTPAGDDNSQQPSWASMDETPSLREIQEHEAAQRELAQMEEQQRKRQQQQQQQQQAQQQKAGAVDVAWSGGKGNKKPTLAEIQAEELKQQQKRQKELQQQHKQQIKVQREQAARSNSPWAGAQLSSEGTTLSLREIQELEQRKAQEEAQRRKKNSTSGSGAVDSLPKLLWETRLGGSSDAISLSEIMAQEAASTQTTEEPSKPAKKESPSADSSDVWSASGSGTGHQQQPQAASSPAPKASLRDIQQQEEQKTGKKDQKKGGKGSQPSTPGQQEKTGKKQQPAQSPQKGNQKKQQQMQVQHKGVWGAVPTAPKTSLLDIQVTQQQRAVSPPPQAAAPTPAAVAAPRSAPATTPVSGGGGDDDDFWGASDTPAGGKGGKGGDGNAAPAIIDESHFPALGGGASKANGGKKAAQQPAAPAAAKKGPNWASKTSGAASPATTPGSGSGARRASQPQQQAQPQAQQQQQAKAPKAAKSQAQGGGAKASSGAAGGAASNAGKKKMQKLDPSMLGFSSNIQDRIVLPTDE